MSLVTADEHMRLTNSPAGGHHPHSAKPASLKQEVRLLIQLAIPTVITLIGFTLPTFLTSSVIGKQFGYLYLDGYTLSNLTGNLCTLSVLQGLYSASETLSPQAYGAGNLREVGLVAIRGLIGSAMVMIPINFLLVCNYERILLFFGQDPEPAQYAARYYKIYILYIPFYALYMVTWIFLTSQSVINPVTVVILSSFVVLPIALQVFTHYFGADGAVAAVVFYQMYQALTLLFTCYIYHPHHADTWPGLGAWREALQWNKFKHFMVLGFGGMLASLEWVYWEALSLLIGSLGKIALSIHAIPTQIVSLTFMVAVGTGTALSVRMGVLLSHNVSKARTLAIGCLIACIIGSAVTTVLLYVFRQRIFRLFTDEPEVLQGAEAIWVHVCMFAFNLYIFGINMGLATGLAMQWTLGLITIIFMWMIGLPSMYYLAIVCDGGIEAAWSTIWPAYVGINTVTAIAYCRKDWDELSRQIRIREGLYDALEDDNEDNSTEFPAKYGAVKSHSLDGTHLKV